MKRLIRRAFGVSLYHGTTLSNLKNITSVGQLIPQESSNGAGLGKGYDPNWEGNKTLKREEDNFYGYTFLATELKGASFYSSMAVGSPRDPRVVLEVDISEDALLPDDNDCPDCKTWEESAHRVQQVKVLGSISSNYFKNVYFFRNYGSFELIFQCPFNGWEEEFKKRIDEIYS